ncbi:hypothetical protein HNQ07_004699 [Deinococcus metalli]|uniref:Uncharacterized protein n=1 Tax=Deinococcus metalli TaxID=1141878 RepID=A0A7W8KM75_9DEIO|nr:hypothetical protein [Deinococcus metalli]MBB5379184.1 hypothetical protein [Deinococcus metalli]GHF65287.1 hypothetical protein GCM10017781_46280 [Deinococcus metalli]
MKAHNILYLLGFGSIILSASQYFQSDTSDKERDGLFIGHWAPTFFILGKILEDKENAGRKVTD